MLCIVGLKMRNTRLAPVSFLCHCGHGRNHNTSAHPAPCCTSASLSRHTDSSSAPPNLMRKCTPLPRREDQGPNGWKQTMHRCGTGSGATAVTSNHLAFKGISRISECDLESLLHGAANGPGSMAEGKCAAPITQTTAQGGSCPSRSCLHPAAHNPGFTKALASDFI